MTNEEIEQELQRLATLETSVENLRSELRDMKADVRSEFRDLRQEIINFHREMATQTRWLIGTMIALQIPTWVSIVQLWTFLATLASHLPK